MNLARATLWQASDPTDPNSVPPQTITQDGATITYSGTYNSTISTWTVKGVATLPSSNPGAPPITRTATSQVKVGSGDIPDDNTKNVWSTLFVDDWQTCTRDHRRCCGRSRDVHTRRSLPRRLLPDQPRG